MRGNQAHHAMRGWPRKNWEGAAWSSSCSRNARPQKALVRRTQSRINQAAPEEADKQAWEDHSNSDAPSTAAVRPDTGAVPKDGKRASLEGAISFLWGDGRSTHAVGDQSGHPCGQNPA